MDIQTITPSTPITPTTTTTDDDSTNATTSETDTSLARQVSEATQSSADVAEEFTTFLTLLTAQIQNQDPLAPLDSTQFVEQLATFSSLELAAEGNQTLESIASLLAEQNYLAVQGLGEDETATDI